MVEIANQAYANSQIAHRIRLVHAMQVGYPDNTSNDAALEALTGFRAPSTRTTPDPGFRGIACGARPVRCRSGLAGA